MAEPSEQMMGTHVVRMESREPIGEVFVFGDRPMPLVEEVEHIAILVQNALTGVNKFLGRSTTLVFQHDQLETHRVIRSWNQSEKHEMGSLPHILEQRGSRSLKIDIDEQSRARGGNPGYRSKFKHPNYGRRLPKRSRR